MSIERLTSLPGGKGIPLQLHSRMVAVGLKPIIYSVLNKHMGQQCQIRPHRAAQKIKSNLPKQETYTINTVSWNGAASERAASIEPCRFFDADPRKQRDQKRERKYGICWRTGNPKIGCWRHAVAGDAILYVHFVAGTYLEQKKQGGNKLHTLPKFNHAPWFFEHTLLNILLPAFDEKF